MMPSSSTSNASSKPRRTASCTASIEFRYWPQAFAVAGMASELNFFQRETVTWMPFSSASAPRYAPHGHARMATSTGQFRGCTPRLALP